MTQDFGRRRFAVLHHVGGAGGGSGDDAAPHYDFLFDTSDTSSLIAFRLPAWPPAPGSTLAATKLRDHRRLYLTYEGRITGDRGHVSRVAEGAVGVRRSGDAWMLSHPDGRPFVMFHPVHDAEWRVDVPADQAAGSP